MKIRGDAAFLNRDREKSDLIEVGGKTFHIKEWERSFLYE